MDYLEGESLAGLLKRARPLSLGVACAVTEPALGLTRIILEKTFEAPAA